jgi:MFS family permease
VPVVGFFVSAQTLVQRQTEDRYRGRVFGAFGTVAATMTLLGMLIAGLLADPLGIAPTMSLGAGLYILAGVVALVLRPAPTPATPPLADGVGTTANGD